MLGSRNDFLNAIKTLSLGTCKHENYHFGSTHFSNRIISVSVDFGFFQANIVIVLCFTFLILFYQNMLHTASQQFLSHGHK